MSAEDVVLPGQVLDRLGAVVLVVAPDGAILRANEAESRLYW